MKQELGDLDKVVSTEVDSKLWSYMETRASLLLKAYETNIEVCLILTYLFFPLMEYSVFILPTVYSSSKT